MAEKESRLRDYEIIPQHTEDERTNKAPLAVEITSKEPTSDEPIDLLLLIDVILGVNTDE